MALSRAQYDEAMRLMQERRREAQRESDLRQEELLARIPGVISIEEQMLKAADEEVRARISGDISGAGRLRKERAALAEEKNRLMREAGYAEDYAEPRYACARCHDTGYIGSEKCGCLKQLESEMLLRGSGLPLCERNGSLEDVELSVYDDIEPIGELKPRRITQHKYIESVVLPTLRHFAGGIGTGGKNNILMYGPAGTGKTFFAARLAREFISMQMSVAYERAGEVFEILSRAQFSKNEVKGAEELTARLSDSEVLILDDLGTEFQTEYTRSRLFTLISDRLNNDLSTIITTNMSLMQLRELYSERLSSRLMGGYLVVPFYGKDIRIQRGMR